MIHLIVGNTGSGKTTYCNQLKAQNKGVIFSIDTWNKTLFLSDKKETDGLDWFLERIDRAEEMIKSLILQLENASTDSILDLGLSKFSHREKFRKFALENNIEFQFHYLNISKEERWQRILKRNSERGITYEFDVSLDDFNFMEGWFEEPTNQELNKAIIISL
ncbi:AAA family ATPase [Flavobacterium terrigena]|uniref:Predicted kinase n=1 Tax=Flavobacterium terrigena TaxID=402734 RepID=A0A1H6QUT4_9FLAO|nr:ATP-binding protein [Flavobacterium terrigena]SEI43240.1 Predicted kinase [Flavobacterium terrigena]